MASFNRACRERPGTGSICIPEKMSAEKAEFTLVKGDEDAALDPQDGRKNRRRRKTCIAVSVVIAVVLILVAFAGGYLVRRALKLGCDKHENDSDKHSNDESDLGSLYKEAIQGISRERIEEKLR